jgi:hypothetical protein
MPASILRSVEIGSNIINNSTNNHSIDQQRHKTSKADDCNDSNGKPTQRAFHRTQAADEVLPNKEDLTRVTRSKSKAAAEARTITATRNVLQQAIDNAMKTEDPSRRQAAILQLLGDAEVDR